MSKLTEVSHTINAEKIINKDMEKNIDPRANEWRSTIAQVVATLGFCNILVNIGFIFLMPTIVIGGLMNSKEELTLNDQSASWFGSIIFIAQPLGSIISGFLQDILGRKRSMMLVNIPLFVAWLMLYFAQDIYMLYTAASLMGLNLGFLEAPALSYIGEITQPRIRGPLSLMAGSMAGVGLLIECLIGAMTTWRNTCAISSSVPVIAFITISMIPESPTWLICVGRIEEAERALCWLRGWVHPVYVREELMALLAYTNSPNIDEIAPTTDDKEHKEIKQGQKKSQPLKVITTFQHLTDPKIYRPLMLVLIFFFISHNVSLLGMRPFLVKIFTDMGMPLDPYWVLVLSYGVQVSSGIVCMLVMRSLGKRVITFISLIVAVIGCLLMGVFLMIPTKYPWIIFALFCVICFGSGFGVCPLPWVLLSEVYPLEGRGIACGISAAMCYAFGFVITKTYINISAWFDLYGACFLYGSIGIVGFVYLYLSLPETEGRTLQEIEEFFKDKNKKTQNNKS